MNNTRKDIRNIAIIAHVDHGKTTLVDKMLQQAGTLGRGNTGVDRIMDSNDLERERGITIVAKNTSICLPQGTINIVDTPGHMDFGGEVERTLQMVEGVLLLVDAAEGPLPGTRFVLQKALELNLKPIVVINKIDRKDAAIERTRENIADLFLDIAISEDQLDYPVLYGAARDGYINLDPEKRDGTLQDLFDTIWNYVPAPKEERPELQLLITNLDYSPYQGRLAIGRILNGTIKVGDRIVWCTSDRTSPVTTISVIYRFSGVDRVTTPEATFGDIVVIGGVDEAICIGATVCHWDKVIPLTYVKISEPTLSMQLGVNTSPFAGREGSILTSRQIRDRLFKELRTNVSLRVEDTESPETFLLCGRGQLHLTVLVETMRREGFELQLSAPQVLFREINGQKCEPMEMVLVDVAQEYTGAVIELIGARRGRMENMEQMDDGRNRLTFVMPARGMLGLRGQMLTETRGTATLNHRYNGYEPYQGEIPSRIKGALISMEQGSVTAYALDGLQPRGILFVGPTTEVYEGMIVGEHSRDNDLDVNPTKQKKLTNMRASGTDDAPNLQPPRDFNLETALDWIADDELVEVTPESIRLRKRYLKPTDRKRN
ncbi:MAG: GTP-binding protein [Candidatus Dependentiae bacterium]|nr:GTP-binding protein [Candidatus Dependentiae bacterium]